MKSSIIHLQINIQPENVAFYKDLMTFLGWSVIHADESMVGVACESGSSLWFLGVAKAIAYDYDGPGMNHVGISVSSQAEVDQTVAYLAALNVPALFETPRHRAEFSAGPDSTYYQVMFESPDRILFEVVYTGPKDA